MTGPVASPWVRLRRLIAAHWALWSGTPERSLELLRDPIFAGSSEARALRRRALDRLCERAERYAAEGRDASVVRLLGVVAGEDRGRARDWRARLVPAGGPPPGPLEPEELQGDDAPSAMLGSLLAQMRSESPNAPDSAGADSPTGTDREASGPGRARGRSARGPDAAVRFQMAVDDGGEFLVVTGSRVTLGHSSVGVADVPVLADVESIHAVLTLSESFHGGTSWSVEPAGASSIHIRGEALAGPCTLADGDVVALSDQVSFRFRLPEASSSSALLEWLGGIEADGAARVLLFAPGAAGRLRIGARRARHVPVAGLEYEVTLVLEQDALMLSCEGGVRIGFQGEPDTTGVVPLPLSGRVDVVANARPSRRPPFGITLQPPGEVFDL